MKFRGGMRLFLKDKTMAAGHDSVLLMQAPLHFEILRDNNAIVAPDFDKPIRVQHLTVHLAQVGTCDGSMGQAWGDIFHRARKSSKLQL